MDRFGISVTVVQDIINQVRNFLYEDQGVTITLVRHLFEGAAYIGAWELLKLLKGKVASFPKIQAGRSIIEINIGNKNYNVQSEVVMIVADPKCRKKMAGVAKPLKREGVDQLTITSKDLTQSLDKSQADYFEPPEVLEQSLTKNTIEMWFSIVGQSFKEGLKWKLTDGEKQYYVSIVDPEFWSKFNRNEISFFRDDRIKTKLLITQVEDDRGNLKITYEALEILEHHSSRPRPRQHRLSE